MFVSSVSATDDVSISGFKDGITEQIATEAATVQEQEETASPDTVSATSQSTDDPSKDTVKLADFAKPSKEEPSIIHVKILIKSDHPLSPRCRCWC